MAALAHRICVCPACSQSCVCASWQCFCPREFPFYPRQLRLCLRCLCLCVWSLQRTLLLPTAPGSRSRENRICQRTPSFSVRSPSGGVFLHDDVLSRYTLRCFALLPYPFVVFRDAGDCMLSVAYPCATRSRFVLHSPHRGCEAEAPSEAKQPAGDWGGLRLPRIRAQKQRFRIE